MNLLVFEELTASSQLWRDSSESMRLEALQMLLAILEDFAKLEAVSLFVLVNEDVRQLLDQKLPVISETLHVITLDQNPGQWITAPTISPEQFDATFVVAPETDGLLTQRLRALQTLRWSHATSLNLSWSLSEVFSDKRRTFDWLKARGIATPTTWTLSEFDRQSNGIPEDAGDLFVLKPRDGAGSDRVQRFDREHLKLAAESIAPPEREHWIVQPWIPGVACSFGLIGGGLLHTGTILPGAIQQIDEDNGKLAYRGGAVPCEERFWDAMLPLALKMQQSLGNFRGYIGVDVVVPMRDSATSEEHAADHHEAQIIEVNPRLCTSYVGYRKLCRQNLAAKFLGLRSPDLEWNSHCVEF